MFLVNQSFHYIHRRSRECRCVNIVKKKLLLILLESCTEWSFRFRALLFWRRIGASCIYYIYHLPANCHLRVNHNFYLVHFHSGLLGLRTTTCCTVSIFQFLLMIINYTNKHWNTKDSCWPWTMLPMRMISWYWPRCKICSEWFVFSEQRSLFTNTIIYPAIHRRIENVLIFKFFFL